MFKLDKHSSLVKKFKKLDYNLEDNSFLNNINSNHIQQLWCFKNELEQQVYLLNKLYKKTISKQKQVFDKCCFDFANLIGTKKQPKTLKTLLNKKYKTLIDNINDFTIYEKIVKNNLSEFTFVKQEITHNFKFNNETKNTLKGFDLNIPVPTVSYCEQDIKKKVNYINYLYNNFDTQKLKEESTYEI